MNSESRNDNQAILLNTEKGCATEFESNATILRVWGTGKRPNGPEPASNFLKSISTTAVPSAASFNHCNDCIWRILSRVFLAVFTAISLHTVWGKGRILPSYSLLVMETRPALQSLKHTCAFFDSTGMGCSSSASLAQRVRLYSVSSV